MFKTDTWLKRVLLAVLAPLRFLRFGRQTLLLINVMSLHLTTVEDLNRECFFFNLHSYCIFLIFLPKNLNLHEKKCQTLLLLVPTPQSTLQAPPRVLLTTILLPYHQVLCTPRFPFPIHPLPPQVFILEEVAPFDWSDEEEENSKELQLRAKDDAEDAATVAFMDAPTRCRRRQRLSQSSSESTTSRL